MTTLVRIHRKGQMTLPRRLRSAIGIAEGDMGKIREDIRHGRVFGPFHTAEEMAASMEANIKKLRAAKRKTKPAR